MKKVSEHLTQEECQLILKIPDQRTVEGKRDFAILKIMLGLGLRKQEVCNLKIGNIKAYNNQYCLLVKGKGNRERRQPIGNITILQSIQNYRNAIKDCHLSNIPDENPLFLTLAKHGPWEQRALTPTAVDCLVRKCAKMALIKKRITPHSLRHTFCTLGLRSGIDLITMKNLMGHSSIQSTQVYLHSDEERKFEAVKKLTFA